jgi:perosamine synthetase
MGVVQCGRLDSVIERKRNLAARYQSLLSGIPGLQLPVELSWARHVYWMYGITVGPEFGVNRDQLATALRQEGIETRTFFCPMNMQPCLQRAPGYRPVPCPVAERLWQQGLYLPSSQTLTPAEVETIAGTIRAIHRKAT